MNGVQIGDVVAGRYRLDEFVGSGGMATVYRATDQRLGRTVAVKVFLQGAAGRGDEARRVSETRLLASLNHHALVTLHDAHLPEEGLAFLVMEYVDGGTLDARLRRGPLSPEDAAALGVELGEALHVVHSAGIIHRDVKPSNILLRAPLTPRGTVRPALADFGIAYLVDTTRLTTPRTAIGTAAYLAPE
ncbi:MAG TPA: serine/threonine protein kinase, partial [Microbacterium sp.]|nr:serine/threonine protein kinase [Microbacterium sp.]